MQEGDSIRVLYESLYFRGQEVATGNVLAAEITSRGKTYYGYYFENGNQDSGGNYYDEHGKALKKVLMVYQLNVSHEFHRLMVFGFILF